MLSPLLASIPPRTFREALFSWNSVEGLLGWCVLWTFAAALYFAVRHRPLPPPFISWRFALALCPILIGSVVLLVGLKYFVDQESLDSPLYIKTRLSFLVNQALVAACASGIALLAYAGAYLYSRRTRRS